MFFPKTNQSHSPPQAAKELINQLPAIPRSAICQALNVNRANTYHQSKTQVKDQKLLAQINQIRLNNPFYGLRRLKAALSKQGQILSLNRLRRVCNLYNLHPKSYTKKWIKPTDKGLEDTKIPNLIKDSQIDKPNQVWCGDFTYLKFQGLWYYLVSSIKIGQTSGNLFAQISI